MRGGDIRANNGASSRVSRIFILLRTASNVPTYPWSACIASSPKTARFGLLNTTVSSPDFRPSFVPKEGGVPYLKMLGWARNEVR